jgi:hypothetical protein
MRVYSETPKTSGLEINIYWWQRGVGKIQKEEIGNDTDILDSYCLPSQHPDDPTYCMDNWVGSEEDKAVYQQLDDLLGLVPGDPCPPGVG